MTFSELGGHPALLRALEARGYTTPTPVQAAVLDPKQAGRDLLVSSQTGSGKTVAFGLALAPTLLQGAEAFGPAAKPLGLVICPTRELAQQVSRELGWLYAPAGARIVTCVGGMDPRAEAKLLARGAHLVVGTPGRLCDHLDRKQLSLEGLRAVVLDEADEMLDMGFREELERILQETPGSRRTVLFSATLPPDIVELAARYQRDAARIAATPPSGAHQDIEYRLHAIAMREREHAVVNTLRMHEDARAICFCETRNAVAHLHASLVERGFPAVAISGELTQAERMRALASLRDGRARVLVATDVAARGLDLPDLGLVVHADLPHDAQVLQHRSGRTGRAGRKGIAVMLVPFSRRGLVERMLGRARIRANWSPVPTAEVVRALDQERLVAELSAPPTDLLPEDLEVAKRLLAVRTPEELAAALVRAQRAGRPAPEDLPETASFLARPARPRSAPVGPTRPARPHPASAPASAGPGGERPRPSGPRETDWVWFKVNVGRAKKADPKWVLPLLCRRGGVTKAEIGKIQIGDDETRFGVAARAADRFFASARRPDPKERWVRIEPAGEPSGPPRGPAKRPRG